MAHATLTFQLLGDSTFIHSFIPYLTLALIGLANALPISITGSNLSIYLTDCGFEKEAIGLFSLLVFPLSLKLLWTPLIDNYSIPFFSQAPRKGWMIFALGGMALSLQALAVTNVQAYPWLVATSLICLSAFTGCLYMVGLAYELESVAERQYAIGSASVITGYRAGLLVAGAGTLYLAHVASWQVAYSCMAALLVLASLAIGLQKEPFNSAKNLIERRKAFSQHRSYFSGFWHESILVPCRLFFQNEQWKIFLVIIVLFKAGDHLAKSMEGPFYLDLGFDKQDLALASKTWGFATTILGTLAGGSLLRNKQPLFSVALIGFLHAVSLFGYWAQALAGKSYFILYATITIGSATSGMAMTAFIYFLWKICTKQVAQVQYALMFSLFSLKSNLLACFGAYLAAHTTWQSYFGQVFIFSILSSGLLIWLTYQRSPKVQPIS